MTGRAGHPVVWVLLGSRHGDNGQLLSLAAALGWPFEVRSLNYNRLHHLPNWLLGAGTAHLDRGSAAGLAPPWPDLVLASGKRSVPVARRIRAASGGRARLVQIGRPFAPLADFDLIVTTPQYRLPDRLNILHNALPLNRVEPARSASALARWRAAIDALPRPRIAVIAGGDSPPYRFRAADAARLAHAVSALARDEAGSLLVTTGPRTAAPAADALERAIAAPALVHRWRPGTAENPYPAFVAAADRFVVTADSGSVLAETCATGRPVSVFALPRRSIAPGSGLATRVAAAGPLAHIRERLTVAGLLTPARDVGLLFERVIARGWAAPLGAEPERAPVAEAGRELAATAERVKQLFEGPYTACHDDAPPAGRQKALQCST